MESNVEIFKIKPINRFFKIILSTLTLLFAFFIRVFVFIPILIEKRYNTVIKKPPYNISETARALHSSLFIADLHSDSLLTSRNLLKESSYGHVDIPRLIRGNVAIQVFAIPTKVPITLNIEKNSDSKDIVGVLAFLQHWPVRTWWSAKERALFGSYKAHSFEKKSNGKFEIIKTADQLQKYIEKKKLQPQITATILAIEGAHVLENEIDNVNVFYNAGFRIIGLTHFFDNEVGGSAHGINKGGLTEFGKKVIQRMNELNMIVDFTHASPKLIDDVLDITTRPVIVSHTGVKGVFDNNRNLSDQHMRGVAEKKGIIGIGFWKTAVGGIDAEAISASMRYVADLVGVETIALGSDFDGTVNEPFDCTGVPLITEALLKQGFSDKEIGLIMGGNFLRLFLSSLPKGMQSVEAIL